MKELSPTQTSVSTSGGGVRRSQNLLFLLSLSAEAQDKGKGVGGGGELPGCVQRASSSCPGDKACYAGVDWSCVNPAWEYCQGRLQSRKYQEKKISLPWHQESLGTPTKVVTRSQSSRLSAWGPR